jgi:hypothetical protein
MGIKIRVRLEPALEAIVANWPPERRRKLAAKLGRWARQLELSARIIEKDLRALGIPRPPSLKWVKKERAQMN